MCRSKFKMSSHKTINAVVYHKFDVKAEQYIKGILALHVSANVNVAISLF